MEEIISSMQQKITELQTKSNTVRKVVVSPVLPISMFVNGPSGEDAFYLPPGKVTQIALTLIGPKDATLFLNFVTAGSNITEEIPIKLGQKILTRNEVVTDWTIVRARLGTDDLTARLVIGFNFQPTASYVAEKGVEDAGVVLKFR